MNYTSAAVRSFYLRLFREHRMRLELINPPRPVSAKALSLNPFKTKALIGTATLSVGGSNEAKIVCACGFESTTFRAWMGDDADFAAALDHMVDVLDKELVEASV